MISVKKKQGVVIFLCACYVLFLERKAIIASAGLGERVLELLFLICMTSVLTAVVFFLTSRIRNDNVVFKTYLLLFVIQMISMMPLYTQNFMYGDDLWGFATDYTGGVSSGLYFSRPFIEFMKGGVLNTSAQSIRFFRIYNAIILYVFGCIIFRYVYYQTNKYRLALCFSVFAIAGCFAIDCIAYASVFPINMSLVASAISYVFYLKAENETGKRKRLIWIVSAISLFTAFCMYQIGTTIVFILYVIHEKYSQNMNECKRLAKAFVYLIYYAIVTVFYLLVTKAFQVICGIEEGQSGRSQIIHSFEQIYDKIGWFFTCVIPQTINRTIALLFGNSLYNEKNMFYNCTFEYKNVGLFLSIVLGILVLTSIIYTGVKKRSYIYVLIMIAAIPLSIWPFLLLPESTYLTYYALGSILLFIWYICDGIIVIVDFGCEKCNLRRCFRKIVSPLMVIVILSVVSQSNYYAENVWVNYNRDSYEYLANTIASKLAVNGEIKTISIQGSLSPYVGGREYVIFCVNNILNELGYNSEDFNVIQNDSNFYISIFGDDEVDDMREKLGEDRLERLLQYYVHDDLYSRWLYNGMANDDDSLNFLRECFIYTGQMVEDGKDVLLISLEGFKLRNLF